MDKKRPTVSAPAMIKAAWCLDAGFLMNMGTAMDVEISRAMAPPIPICGVNSVSK